MKNTEITYHCIECDWSSDYDHLPAWNDDIPDTCPLCGADIVEVRK